MLKRLSLDHLLKSILAVFALAALLLVGARLRDAMTVLSNSERAETVVSASDEIFTVLTNLRTDRPGSQRAWESDQPQPATARAAIRRYRDAEMPALAKATDLATRVSFAGKDDLLADLRRSSEHVKALQAEYDAGIDAPSANRRRGLGQEYVEETLKLQTILEKLATRLFASIKRDNAMIDQMLGIKQLAWLVRQNAGEASLLVSLGLTHHEVAPDVHDRWTGFVGAAKGLWAAIDDAVAGLDLPADFTTALANAKRATIDAEPLARQERVLNAMLNGQPVDMTADQWSATVVPSLNMMQEVAKAALAVANAEARAAYSDAWWNAVFAGVLVTAVLLASAGGFLIVTRRITAPLLRLTNVTERLSQGDFNAEADFGGRSDEIGRMAEALGTFRRQAIEKNRLEEEQRAARERADARRVAVDGHIQGFEGHVVTSLQALDEAGTQMDHAADNMIQIAARGASGVQEAEHAAEQASENVSSIAAATEELNSSISEIARQVSQAARVSQRAVQETQQTDETVRGLAESASRINEVVSLISNIAAQTNLLALNATIEAARAGEAGKGFAVVASEVKSLANQTARATDEIGTQIASVRNVTQDAVRAISQIRGTIEEVNGVATAIAAAVEEQGVAIQEIARNAQSAAERTRHASESVTAVTAETQATTATADAVKTAATSLGSEASRLRAQVDSFLAGMRAA